MFADGAGLGLFFQHASSYKIYKIKVKFITAAAYVKHANHRTHTNKLHFFIQCNRVRTTHSVAFACPISNAMKNMCASIKNVVNFI